MKWHIEQVDGIEVVDEVLVDPNANPPVIGVEAVEAVEGNHVLRNAEMTTNVILDLNSIDIKLKGRKNVKELF